MTRESTLNPKFSHARKGALVLLCTALFASSLTLAEAVDDPVVTSEIDSNMEGSLRWAIANASDGSEITFDSSLSGLTIRLLLGQLTIGGNLTIDASSLGDPVTISGDKDDSGTANAGDSRVFDISAGGYNVNFRSIIIEGGYQQSGEGGGIRSTGANLTIQDTTITGNTSSGGSSGYPGGGIFQSGGTVTIVNSTISDNEAGSVSKMTDSNATGAGGGGIYVASGTMTIANSTIVGNVAGDASSTGTGQVSGGDGGGIYVSSGATLNLDSSTVVNNYAGDSSGINGTEYPGDGGGIYCHGSAALTIGNSIVADNFAGNGTATDGTGGDIRRGASAVNRIGKNFVGNNDTVETEFLAPAAPGEPNVNGDLVGTSGALLSPQLKPLGDYGGSTMTLMPYFDSIVVNAGLAADRPQDSTDINWNANFTELLPVDQTGARRVSGSEIDLGSVEYQFPTTNPLRVATLAKISKIKKKIQKLNKKGKTARVKRLKKKLKKLKKKLNSL